MLDPVYGLATLHVPSAGIPVKPIGPQPSHPTTLEAVTIGKGLTNKVTEPLAVHPKELLEVTV